MSIDINILSWWQNQERAYYQSRERQKWDTKALSWWRKPGRAQSMQRLEPPSSPATFCRLDILDFPINALGPSFSPQTTNPSHTPTVQHYVPEQNLWKWLPLMIYCSTQYRRGRANGIFQEPCGKSFYSVASSQRRWFLQAYSWLRPVINI